jgi:Raf kinase inhibitor-like YbhB/YbcL family protein
VTGGRVIDTRDAMLYQCRACPHGHLGQLSRAGLAGRSCLQCPVSSNDMPGDQTPEAAGSLSGGEKPSEGNLMFVKRHLGSLAAATGLVLAAWGVGGVANAADPFTLSSATFKDGTMMPRKVANKNPQNPNCVGDNVSPQLSWSGAPEGTKSFAFTMVDPEGRLGLGVYHWVAYGIPANVTSFAEGEVSKESNKYVGGKSTQGVGFFSGPCTPPGSPHHYTYMVIATDLDAKELPPGLTLPELMAKLNGHTKGAAGLVGLFVKPQ